MGIPQIVKRGTQFVEHEKNGYIINGANEFLPALAYYLDGMNHWNEAMIYSYELGRLYTTDVLIQRWKEVISSFE